MTRMKAGRAVTVEVRGAGEEAEGAQRNHCAHWNRGQRALPFTSLPLGPGGWIKTPAGCPPSPCPQAFWSVPPPRRALRLQRLQPGALGEREGLWSRRDFSPRTPARPGLPFPVPQFPTRLQGLKRRLFGPDCSPERGQGRLPWPSPQLPPSKAELSGSTAPRPAFSRRLIQASTAAFTGRRRRGGWAGSGPRAPARSLLRPPQLASPHRVTTALRLQRCKSPPCAGFLGSGGWGPGGSRPRPRRCERVMTPQLLPTSFLVLRSFSTLERVAESPFRNALGTLRTQPGPPGGRARRERAPL